MRLKKIKYLNWYIIFIILAIIIGGVVFYFVYRWNKTTAEFNAKVSGTTSIKSAKEALAETELPTDPINVLVVGNDIREELNDSSYGRTDTIMFLRIDPMQKKAYLISIPRDTFVKIPGHERDKINAAYAWGEEKLLIESANELLDTTINHYIEVDFEGFKKLIDALGGVDITVDEPLIDPKANANFPVGTYHMNGDQALSYVRTRATITADYGRIKRQQNFLKEMIKQHLNIATINKIPDLFKLLQENTQTDLDLNTIVKYAMLIKEMNPESIQMVTLPTHSEIMDNIWYEVPDYDAIVVMMENIMEGRPAERYNAEYNDNGSVPKIMFTNQKKTVQLTVKNTGHTGWTTYGKVTNLSYHIYDYITGKLINYDGPRGPLPQRDVESGESVTIDIDITTPSSPGTLIYYFDMVIEGYLWFSDARVSTYNKVIEIRNPPEYSEDNKQTKVEVKNGSGDENAVDVASRMLSSYGYTFAGSSEAGTQSNIKSMIIYKNEFEEAAKKLQLVFPDAILFLDAQNSFKSKKGADIIFLAGTDFKNKTW